MVYCDINKILYYIISYYCTILYYFMLFYLFYIILFYFILYHIISYYTYVYTTVYIYILLPKKKKVSKVCNFQILPAQRVLVAQDFRDRAWMCPTLLPQHLGIKAMNHVRQAPESHGTASLEAPVINKSVKKKTKCKAATTESEGNLPSTTVFCCG